MVISGIITNYNGKKNIRIFKVYCHSTSNSRNTILKYVYLFWNNFRKSFNTFRSILFLKNVNVHDIVYYTNCYRFQAFLHNILHFVKSINHEFLIRLETAFISIPMRIFWNLLFLDRKWSPLFLIKIFSWNYSFREVLRGKDGR